MGRDHNDPDPFGGFLTDIYNYIDYRGFLSDWFAEKKRSHRRYSHRLFSRQMNQKSPSFLKDIIGRRRNVTEDQLPTLCTVLCLNRAQSQYLRLLISFDQSKKAVDRTRAFDQIAATRRVHSARLIEGDTYLYLSRWYCPAIRELTNLPHFQADPAWIIERIQPRITNGQAQEALDILTSLGMMTVLEDGTVELDDGTLTTPPEVMGLAVHNYHREMLRLASESIDRFEPEERHLIGVTVPANAELIEQLKTELNQVAARLCDICDSDESLKDRALQLNLHFYPLSQPPTEHS